MAKRSVQTETVLNTHGGKRKNAGRVQTKARRSEAHRRREAITPAECAHVVIRVERVVGGLRRWKCYRAINRALRVVATRAAFRIVHASIQRTHVHLLVEADDAGALASGMQGFQISAARQLNRELGRERGGVFVDRYHATVIRSPVPCRNALNYILNNWRKHQEQHVRGREHWILDGFSSAIRFARWREKPVWRMPEGYDPLAVSAPATWLVRAGWAKAAPISMYATPARRPG